MTKVPRDGVTGAEWKAIAEGAVVHQRVGVARYALRGKGALACLQGLVTSDVNVLPDRARTFGALLTAKGMIVTPMWIERTDAAYFLIETPATAAPQLEATFAKSIPPRLAQWENITEATTGLGLYGPRAGTDIMPYPGALPAVARGAAGLDGDLDNDEASLVVEALLDSGAVIASHALMESCRILAGIPKLGAEIDERTLPQEVRMEELGAISYTKGCYLGQETVARLHFRGHANRQLAALVLDDEPGELPADVVSNEKTVGRLTSACWSPELDRWVGQAVIRREIEDGVVVRAGDTGAVVRIGRWPRQP